MNKVWWGHADFVKSYCRLTLLEVSNNKVMKVKARDVVCTSTVVPRIVS